MVKYRVHEVKFVSVFIFLSTPWLGLGKIGVFLQFGISFLLGEVSGDPSSIQACHLEHELRKGQRGLNNL